MGDPDRIDAAAQTWENIGARLGETAEAYRASLSQVESWQGAAGDAYRAKAGEVPGTSAPRPGVRRVLRTPCGLPAPAWR